MHSPLNGKTIGYVVIFLSLASVLIGVKTTIDRQDDVECLAGYIAENARVSKVRTAAATKEREAVSSVIDGVAQLFLTPPAKNAAEASKQARAAEKSYRKIFADYAKSKAEAAAERTANPLPDLPDDCSDVE